MNFCNESIRPATRKLSEICSIHRSIKEDEDEHKEKRAKKSEDRNEQRFPSVETASLPAMGTYCKGNSAHSQSLPPLVNYCNIRAGGIRC